MNRTPPAARPRCGRGAEGSWQPPVASTSGCPPPGEDRTAHHRGSTRRRWIGKLSHCRLPGVTLSAASARPSFEGRISQHPRRSRALVQRRPLAYPADSASYGA